MDAIQAYIDQLLTMQNAAQSDSDAETVKIDGLKTQLSTEQTQKAADQLVIEALTDLITKLQGLLPVPPATMVR
jgi:hypothetical protein